MRKIALILLLAAACFGDVDFEVALIDSFGNIRADTTLLDSICVGGRYVRDTVITSGWAYAGKWISYTIGEPWQDSSFTATPYASDDLISFAVPYVFESTILRDGDTLEKTWWVDNTGIFKADTSKAWFVDNAGLFHSDGDTNLFDFSTLAKSSELISVGEIWGYGSRTLTDTAVYTWFVEHYDSFKATTDTAYISAATGTYQLDLYSYLSTDSTVISGAWLAVYASGELGGTPLWNANTSSDSGLARFNVDAGTYDIRATKSGYYGIDTSLTVSADTDCELYIDQTAWPVAPDTQYCMVVFDALDLGYSVPEGEQVKIKIQSIPQYYDGAGISTSEVTATYDAAGRASASLIRGAGIRVSISALGFVGTGTVPDTSAIGWRDYYPTGGTTRWLIQR